MTLAARTVPTDGSEGRTDRRIGRRPALTRAGPRAERRGAPNAPVGARLARRGRAQIIRSVTAPKRCRIWAQRRRRQRLAESRCRPCPGGTELSTMSRDRTCGDLICSAEFGSNGSNGSRRRLRRRRGPGLRAAPPAPPSAGRRAVAVASRLRSGGDLAWGMMLDVCMPGRFVARSMLPRTCRRRRPGLSDSLISALGRP
jgi:hypothetical protein